MNALLPRPRRRRTAGMCLAVLLGSWLVADAGASAPSALPPEVQAALLKKVFLFDRDVANDAKVLVVFPNGAAEGAARRLVDAFAALDVAAEPVAAGRADDRVSSAGVVYFFPGADAEALRSLCVKHRRLSVAGVTTMAEAGQVAVAVGLSTAGSPEVVVHRRRLGDEGHHLEPRVLQLARLVG